MSKFTPGPWRRGTPGPNGCYTIGTENGLMTAVVAHSIHCSEQVQQAEANARLIAAAPDLLEAQTMGAEVNTPDFLDWIADRLINSYGVNPNVDFVHSLRERAKAGRAAIAKATGE